VVESCDSRRDHGLNEKLSEAAGVRSSCETYDHDDAACSRNMSAGASGPLPASDGGDDCQCGGPLVQIM
jgi:hypothetical protein